MIVRAHAKLWQPGPALGSDPEALREFFDVLRVPKLTEFTDFMENAIGQFFFRNDADTFTTVATLYCALFTAATTDAGGGTEVSGNAYARTSFSFDAWSGTSGLQDNAADITFPAASGGNWGTITHAAIMDAATVGNMYAHSPLDSSVVINDTDIFEILAGNLDLTIA